MKITLVHPLKHHVYNSAIGVKDSKHELEAIFGFYDKYDLIKKSKIKMKSIKRLQTYSDSMISETVKTSLEASFYFLLAKKSKNFEEIYNNNFQKFVLKNLNATDIVYVLQDYSQDVIDYCCENDIKMIYEQIMPCGFAQRDLIIEESKKLRFDSAGYVDKFFSVNKIENNYKNIRNASLVINASKLSYEVAKDALQGKDNEKNIIIPYGTNTTGINEKNSYELFSKKFSDLKNRNLKILYVGSLSLLKGTQYLVEVMQRVQNLRIEFGVVGIPNQLQDKDFIHEFSKLDNVTYYGSVPHSHIANIYQQYDIFILPSLVEGFGMVSLEAMSYGLPCIVNENSQGVVIDNYNGYITNAGKIDSIVKSIEKIDDNRDNLEKLAINAYYTSLEYTWKRFTNSITEQLNKRF